MKKATFQPPLYPDPPIQLTAESQQLWRELGPEYATTRGRQVLFAAALQALDRSEECHKAIERDGLTTRTKSTGAQHLNPLLKLEVESRRQFAALWAQLGISDPPPDILAGLL